MIFKQTNKYAHSFKHGYMYKLKNSCSYVLAADAGDTFTLIVDQEIRYPTYSDAFYIKQVRVQLWDVEYTITENFYVSVMKTNRSLFSSISIKECCALKI